MLLLNCLGEFSSYSCGDMPALHGLKALEKVDCSLLCILSLAMAASAHLFLQLLQLSMS